VLHLGVCLSIIPLVRTLGCDSPNSLGAVAALLMAVHTANTHAVATLEGRGEMLQTLFVIGAMVACGHRIPFLAFGCALAAALSSGLATSAVFLLLITYQDQAHLQRLLWFAGCILSNVLWWVLRAHPLLHNVFRPGFGVQYGCEQLHQLLWPRHLSVVPRPLPSITVSCIVCVTISLLGAVWCVCYGERWLRPCLLWMLLWGAPLGFLHQALPPLAASLSPGPSYSEASLYCLCVPWCLIAAAMLHKLPRSALLGATLLLLSGHALHSRHRVWEWRDEHRVHSATVATYPRSVEARVALGSLDRHREQPSAAEQQLREAVRVMPNSMPALVQLGEVMNMQGQQGMAQFMKAVKAAPGAPEPYTAIGQALMEQKQLPKAEQSFKTALKFSPVHAPAMNMLGELYMQRGEHDKAKAQYDKAAEAHPSFFEAQNNLGTVLMRLGHAEQAVSAFDAALRLPKSRNVFLTHYNIASALQMLGRLDDAIGHYETSIALNGEYPNFYFNMAVALQKKAQHLSPGGARDHTLDKTIHAYQWYLQYDASDPQAHYNLGYALDDRGQKQESQKMFMAARKLNPALPPYRPG